MIGNTQTYIAASLTACSVYVAYVYIYRSYKRLKTNVLINGKLPSSAYLYLKYLSKAVTRRTGCLYAAATGKSELVYTVISCRLDTLLLRRFCNAAGYGWDYPDTEYRDIPLCFPEFLCRKLLFMVVTDEDFRLSPAGLVHVRQSLKTVEPVDELKKGPFKLQARVLVYRRIDAGVEVDICLSAISRTGCPVWESVLTLLSRNKTSRLRNENDSQPDEPVPEIGKQVELKVPRNAGLTCVWALADYSPYRLLLFPAKLFACRSQTSASLWMLSVCLAEIEKHKGVEVITPPVNITVQFMEPPSVPGKVTIRFWETTENVGQSSAQSLRFSMQRHGSNISHMMGLISRS